MSSRPPQLERPTTTPEERGALAEVPPRTSPGMLLLSALLPGAGHLARGVWVKGMWLLIAWGVTLGTLYLTWGRVQEALAAPVTPMDVMVSLATLIILLAAIWAWTMYDLTVRSNRPKGRKGTSQWAIAARHFRKNKIAIAGLVVMLLLYVITLLTPLIAPFDPAEQGDIVAMRYLPPSFDHFMGTDKFGRDVFSRVLYGARISLSIGFIAVGIGVVIGTMLGSLAGYFGKAVDTVIMRFTDMMLAIPRLVLLIVVIALFDRPDIWMVVIVLGLTGWMSVARIVRGEILSLREREFVQAAKALGMSDVRIITRHILPNTLAPIIVFATLGIGNTILIEAGLSFLGLGVQPPTPSWGNMITDGRDALITAWWIATFPGLAIVFTVTAFNLLGDGLRDALDPRLR
jgi:peptide/nickel transport system permease protein